MRRLPVALPLRRDNRGGRGLTIHGTPWTPTFYDWAFMRDDDELAETGWGADPEGADIVLTHGPPLGHGDLVVNGKHAGSATLARRIEALPGLRLHIFGHIHEAGGSRGSRGSATRRRANVSYVDFEDYSPAQPAAVFEL